MMFLDFRTRIPTSVLLSRHLTGTRWIRTCLGRPVLIRLAPSGDLRCVYFLSTLQKSSVVFFPIALVLFISCIYNFKIGVCTKGSLRCNHINFHRVWFFISFLFVSMLQHTLRSIRHLLRSVLQTSCDGDDCKVKPLCSSSPIQHLPFIYLSNACRISNIFPI